MATRLIQRLDGDIAAAEGVLERETLKARRAAVLARHGSFSEARFALAGLRSQSTRLRLPVLAAWVALVDGLIEHCESLAATAREKFARAHALAGAAGDEALLAECAAWLALSDFNANALEDAVRHVAEALRVAPAGAHAARARAAQVVADAWRYAGEDEEAAPWYQLVRHHATAEGDVSLVSTLLYNKAAFLVSRAAFEDALGRGNEAEAQRVLLETESTRNYDAGVGNAQIAAAVPLMRAQVLTALGRHAEAVAVFDAQMPHARSEGQAHREARFLADAAWGEVQLGRLDEAARRLRLIQAVLPLMDEPDDLAATHARLSGVMRALGRDDAADHHEALSRAAERQHLAEQQRLREVLQRGLAGVSPDLPA